KGTTVGTTSDGAGKFNLQAPSSGTLLFTMVGYQAKEISFAQQTVLSVVLQETAELVDEVVVVGYNVVKRSDLTGSITSIGAEEITAMPVTNSLQALQGRTSGVDVTSNERPGEVGSIRVRG